jgi:hypothetical protein
MLPGKSNRCADITGTEQHGGCAGEEQSPAV